MKTTEERFKGLLADRKKEADINKNSLPEHLEHFSCSEILDFSPINDMTNDVDLKNFLITKSKELIENQAYSLITIGKILTEVAEKLKNTEETYSKFVEYCGFNTKTALRLRKRYELYSLAKKEIKSMIVLLSVREIEELYKNKDLLDKFTPGIKLLEIKELIKDSKVSEEKIIKDEVEEIKTINDFKFFKNSYQDKFENLDLKKQNKVLDLLKKIEKIMEK